MLDVDSKLRIEAHLERLRACRACPQMQSAPVCGRAVAASVMVVGQAPGNREPKLNRPFAWTAGRTLFRWFEQAAGLTEEQTRSLFYFAAVCRCFPGKKPTGGDRAPSRGEIERCSVWLRDEIQLLRPKLVIAVGKLAIAQFAGPLPLESAVGTLLSIRREDHSFDLLALPHPSGVSPWPKIPPGKALLKKALSLLAQHPAVREAIAAARRR